MELILKLLASDLSFLYRCHKFRVIDSEFVESFGGSAYITLASENLKVRLVQSRDGLAMEFGENRKIPEWYLLDIIQRFISDKEGLKCDGDLNSESLLELKEKMNEVISSFSKEKISSTKKLLSGYEKERSQKLFTRTKKKKKIGHSVRRDKSVLD